MTVGNPADSKIGNHFIHQGDKCVAIANWSNETCTNAAEAPYKHLNRTVVLFERLHKLLRYQTANGCVYDVARTQRYEHVFNAKCIPASNGPEDCWVAHANNGVQHFNLSRTLRHSRTCGANDDAGAPANAAL